MNTRTTTATAASFAARPSAPAVTADHWLVAQDGRHLAASWVEPEAPARAVAVIGSAAGVPRGYYRAFAGWLAGRGYAVLSYDYRGIGGSRRGALRDDPATMRDWAVLDMSAALAAAEARRAAADLPLLLVGHSFGGNCIAFADGVERADAILCVASQLGEPRHYPRVHRAVANLFFRAWLPAVVGLRGHAPGWALGPGAEPLPAGVARQWAAWGRRRGWAYADPAMAPHRAASAVFAPVHLWGLSDDLRYAPPRAIDALAEQYRNAVTERHTLAPQQVGLRRLGHFGVFRREPGALAWRRLLAPIEQASRRLRDAGLAPLD
jgi:predicted alpha/beta hydrolase